jgi:hypothetical protein
MPHWRCREGDIVFVRAAVLEAASDFFVLRTEVPSCRITFYAPAREVARLEDVRMMRPPAWTPIEVGGRLTNPLFQWEELMAR